MGAKPKLDWDSTFDEWVLVVKPKGEITQKAFAIKKGVEPTHLSRRFHEIELDRTTNTAKSKMAHVMIKSLDRVDEALDELDQDDKVTAADKLRSANASFTSTADRLGLSPQANIINIQQSNQSNLNATFIIQPMFNDPDAEDLKNLVGGDG